MVTISVEDLRGWLKNASYHIRLAVAIAALAPKLRLANVLALTWQEHIDPDFHFITVDDGDLHVAAPPPALHLHPKQVDWQRNCFTVMDIFGFLLSEFALYQRPTLL